MLDAYRGALIIQSAGYCAECRRKFISKHVWCICLPQACSAWHVVSSDLPFFDKLAQEEELHCNVFGSGIVCGVVCDVYCSGDVAVLVDRTEQISEQIFRGEIQCIHQLLCSVSGRDTLRFHRRLRR